MRKGGTEQEKAGWAAKGDLPVGWREASLRGRRGQAETSRGGSPGHERACLVLVGGNWASKGSCQARGRARNRGPTLYCGRHRTQHDSSSGDGGATGVLLASHTWSGAASGSCWHPGTEGLLGPGATAAGVTVIGRRSGVSGQWACWDSGASAGRTRRPLREPWLGILSLGHPCACLCHSAEE